MLALLPAFIPSPSVFFYLFIYFLPLQEFSQSYINYSFNLWN